MVLKPQKREIFMKIVDDAEAREGSTRAGRVAEVPPVAQAPTASPAGGGYVPPPAPSSAASQLGATSIITPEDIEAIQHIMDMGFRWETALIAYFQQDKNVKLALEYIIG
ncbi:uncharacterized protein LOC141609274 [Silene latifolia]|uniref:uncharacterized protein LOC141609274 n=1 Tax=Silene latifolia TaxID=37657 RepID=UPI003D787361